MYITLVVLAFITGSTLIYGIYFLLAADRLHLEKRLNQIKEKSILSNEINEEE